MPGPANQQVTVVDVRESGSRYVPELYHKVMVPSFAPDELETEEELVRGLRSGRSRVLVAVGTDGDVLGGAVGEYFPLSQVMLLAYLAVLPGGRGGGVGSTVLQAARDAWTAELSPRLIVLEVEDPRDFTGSEAFGDPVARAVDGQHVALFVAEYFEEFEGTAQPGDTELELLLSACARPGGPPLLTVDELPSTVERRNIPWL